MKSPILVLLAANLMAQTAMQLPWLGAARDSAGRIRNIYGVSGNFLAGEPAGEPVLSAAFSRKGSVVKTATALQVFQPHGTLLLQCPSVDGPALFSFDADGAPAYVYLPSSQALLQWNTGKFSEVTPPIEGEVRSLAVTASGDWTAAVRRNGQVLRLTAAGIVETYADDVADVILLSGGRSVLVCDRELRIGSKSLTLPEPLAAVEWMSDDWLQLTAGANHYALRIKPGREELFRLPEVQ